MDPKWTPNAMKDGLGRGGQGLRSKPTLVNPTLAKPTLANVKVLVVCKDFGFSELIVWVF